MSLQSLSDWLSWMESVRPEHDIDFSLERIRTVGQRLSLLKPAPIVITVGGTNGKGSTLAVLESILLAAGFKVGLFTSPHIIRFNERVRINGTMAIDQQLCDAFAIINAARSDENSETTWLSYFEFATLAAAYCFQQAQVDIALMEVGLGGRLDATNAIEPDIAVVTTIGLDHQAYLGDTVEAIAREKAGIFRANKPAIFGDASQPQAIASVALDCGAKLLSRGVTFDLEKQNNTWSWFGVDKNGDRCILADLPIPLVVIDNAATALQAIELLPQVVSDKSIRQGLQQAHINGRFQRVMMRNDTGVDIEVIIDVAHNPQAAQMLSQRLIEYPVAGKTYAVFAAYKDKDYCGVIEALASQVNSWWLAQFDSIRALPVTKLQQRLAHQPYEIAGCFETVTAAVHNALSSAEENDRVLITGSFITVATALALLQTSAAQ